MWQLAERFLVGLGGFTSLIGGFIGYALYTPDDCTCWYSSGKVGYSDEYACPIDFDNPGFYRPGITLQQERIVERECSNAINISLPGGVGNVSKEQAIVTGALPGLALAAIGLVKHIHASIFTKT